MIKELKVYKYINEIPIYRFIFEPIRSNMYIAIYKNQALVIDPFVNEAIKELFENNSISNVTIILTHEHFDHISGVNWFRELYPCEVIASRITKSIVESVDNKVTRYYMALFIGKPEEEKIARKTFVENYICKVDKTFEKKMEMDWCSIKIILRETPGHSEGSICIIFNEKYIFTGDTLVGGSDIITRLPGGSKKKYLEFTKPYLLGLKDDLYIFPGHGESGYIVEFHII